MKIDNNEIRVFFKHNNKFIEELDKAIRETIEGIYDVRSLGCFFVDFMASGYDHKTGVRELVFQLEFKEKK